MAAIKKLVIDDTYEISISRDKICIQHCLTGEPADATFLYFEIDINNWVAIKWFINEQLENKNA